MLQELAKDQRRRAFERRSGLVGSWCIELKIRLPRSPQRDLPKALLRLCLQRQLAGMVLQPKLRPLQGRCRKLRKVYTTVQTYYILLTDT